MRTQLPHASQRDVPGDIHGTGAGFTGRGLCCPDDPLDLVLRLFPAHTAADRAPPSSLAAIGIGGGEPPLREHEPPKPLAESAYGVGAGGWDSWSLSSFVIGELCGLEEIDVDEFFADDALDAGEATQGNLLDPTRAGPSPPQAHITCGGSLGGAVPNDASPLPAPMPVRSFPFQANAACRAFDAAVFNNTPPSVFVTHNSTSLLPALMPPAAPAPMPPTASLDACAALPDIVSNSAPAPPARALHPNAALAGVYFSSNALAAHIPPSVAPSSSPPSRASSGSGRYPSSSTTSEIECLQPHHDRVVPRKQRSAPAVNRRKRSLLLDFPLHALPPVAPPPPADPDGDDDEDAQNRNVALVLVAPPLPAGNNTGGGDDSADTGGGGMIRRRRPVPRQRNRQAQRVCSHCHSAETPQWRAGPDGPGTLCNACGIRYAANRLLPEYRPSTAPSFRSGQHSNRHRKVIKLRDQVKRAAAATTEEPSSEQGIEDGTYQHQARDTTPLDQFNYS